MIRRTHRQTEVSSRLPKRGAGPGPLVEQLEARTLLSISFGSAVATTLFTTSGTSSTVTVDLNGDGIPDLVAAHPDGASETFLGTSTGLLQPGQIFSTGAQLVAVADFTGDSKLDLATASGVLPGSGNGTFSTPIPGFMLPANSVNLLEADFNDDGKTDLAAAIFVPASGSTPASISLDVMLGNGDGTFQAPIVTPVATGMSLTMNDATFAVADFNGDGKMDVVSRFGVLLGRGNGMFKPIMPLVLASPSAIATSVFTIGDFNGDGHRDLAVLTSSATSTSNPGQIEILLGKGDGTFQDAGAVTPALTGTITTLAGIALTTDGRSDLVAGVTSATGTSRLAILLSNGDGTFAAPAIVPLTGVPISISSGDFNADKQPDLLVVVGAAGPVTSNATLSGVAADVFLNNTPAPQTASITLKAARATSVVGTALQFTAAVTAPAGSPAPTGTVTFTSGATSLGSAPIHSGLAKLSTAALPAGIDSIAAIYNGDVNYSPVTSASISETVLLTAARMPDLVASVRQVSLPAIFLNGDAGSVTVTITNLGGGPANGQVGVNLDASSHGMLDASAIPIVARRLRTIPLQLPSGGVATFTAPFIAGNYPAGSYSIVGKLVPVARFTSAEVSSTPFTGPGSFQTPGKVFGTVGTHAGLISTVVDSAGRTARLSITGAGMGTITQGRAGMDVMISGTSSTSIVRIVTGPAGFSFDQITDRDPLDGLLARNVQVTGSVKLSGGASQLRLAGVGAAAGPPGSMMVGGSTPVSLTLGNVQSIRFTSMAPIAALHVINWQSGAISAPFIGRLIVSGLLGADVLLHMGGRLQVARIGGITGGNWAVPGGIEALRVTGNVANARIFAGADAGMDNRLGTVDDTYAPQTISLVFIGGSDISTTIAAGAAPPAGGTINTGLVLLRKGAIRVIVVAGSITSDSRFLAASLPRKVILDGATVLTATDPHFQV